MIGYLVGFCFFVQGFDAALFFHSVFSECAGFEVYVQTHCGNWKHIEDEGYRLLSNVIFEEEEAVRGFVVV